MQTTATQYNNHNVSAYDVLIRTASGKVVESHFEDDDFNICPSHNLTTYLADGDRFAVRYLKHFPATFVIVKNDYSPWARGLRCGRLARTVGDADSEAEFVPDNQTFQAALAAARQAALAGGCAAS